MGFLDRFKRNSFSAAPPAKCASCFRPLPGRPFMLEGKAYCQECYNRKMILFYQSGSVPSDGHSFRMTIEDVFLIKGHGVAVTGAITFGIIHVNDVVTINDHEYTVTMIDVPREGQTETASQGMHVGLHLSTTDASLFKAGDRVFAKAAAKPPAAGTFVCSVCHKELPIKYRHSETICADCAQSGASRVIAAAAERQIGAAGAPAPSPIGAKLMHLPALVEKLKPSANTEEIYGQALLSAIRPYKAVCAQYEASGQTDKALLNQIAETYNQALSLTQQTLLIVPVFYAPEQEFENDTTLHFTYRACVQFNRDCIVYRAMRMTADQVSGLFWATENGVPTVDMDWWDITRFAGSEGYSFAVQDGVKRVMHPGFCHYQDKLDLHVFTGIDQLKAALGADYSGHIGVFMLSDLADYVLRMPNVRGVFINPNTDTQFSIDRKLFREA